MENIDFNFDTSFDFGGADAGFEIDAEMFGGFTDMAIEPRYVRPRAYVVREENVRYQHAEELAEELNPQNGERYNVIVGGTFVFGDLIEAMIDIHDIKVERMVITTLSMGYENVDSFRRLMEWELVDKLDLVISAYQYAHERRGLVPYIYENLDHDNRFQLAVAGTHTKTVTMECEDGRRIVMQGSANLRSSANVETVCIEENPTLVAFYNDFADKIIEEYGTIKKPIRVQKLWNTIGGNEKVSSRRYDKRVVRFE